MREGKNQGGERGERELIGSEKGNEGGGKEGR